MKNLHSDLHHEREVLGDAIMRSAGRPKKIRIVFEDDFNARGAEILIKHSNASAKTSIPELRNHNKLDALIPVSPRNSSGIRDSSKPAELIHARRILIAEDDDIIRWIMSNTLADDCYAVNAAADGEQAWEALCNDSYDLLVTDNEMPRLTGLKLIERIRKAGMSLPVIVASGNFPVDRARDYPQFQIAAVIPKPFRKLEFLDAVRNVLASQEDITKASKSI